MENKLRNIHLFRRKLYQDDTKINTAEDICVISKGPYATSDMDNCGEWACCNCALYKRKDHVSMEELITICKELSHGT